MTNPDFFTGIVISVIFVVAATLIWLWILWGAEEDSR